MDSFSLYFQYAEQESDESTDLGIKTLQEILSAFDAWDWQNQLELSYKYERTSPTIGIKNLDKNTEFLASIIDTDEFMLFYVQHKPKKLFGLLPAFDDGIDSSEHTKSDVRKAIAEFVSGDVEAFVSRIKSKPGNY